MEQLAQSVRHMATAMTARLAPMTAVVALHMGKVATAGFQVMSVATLMTARLALVTVTHVLHMVTAIHAQATETAMTAAHVVASVQLMVARVQQQVAATVAK
jgi:hypothetical protein